MADALIDLGHGFWNIRGTLKLGGIVNVGTQTSLVRLTSGRFLFLDSYELSGEVRDQVMALTDQGRAVEAVLNLHPFHTLHCEAMARDFPEALFYGSDRHARLRPSVLWEETRVESPELAQRYGGDLQFSLPDGIDYICQNEKVHAGSLLAFHPASGSLHVDDTLNVPPVPGLVRRILPVPRLFLHPTLKSALQDHKGAAQEFLGWLDRIAQDWSATRTLCAAHSGISRFGPGEFGAALTRARTKAARTLKDRAA